MLENKGTMIFRLGMWLIMIFGGIAGGYYMDHRLFENMHHNVIFHIVCFIIGVLLLYLMIRISKNTGRTLTKYGRSGELKRMETNVLVEQGVYQYMRHPMHLGLFLFPLSVAFLVASPSFILIIAPVEILMMMLLIKLIEEPEAIGKFGDAYRAYQKRVPGFCFKKECLKELWKKIPKEYEQR